jgi:hypothetical protein
MADADDVRRLALGLPQVEEVDSDGFDFRVAGKGFVWSYPERAPGKPRVLRTDIAVLYVGDEAEKQALLLGEPRLFFTTPGYDGFPLVMLRLAEVGTARLAELVTDAWRMRAPQSLADELGEPGSLLGERSLSGHAARRGQLPRQVGRQREAVVRWRLPGGEAGDELPGQRRELGPVPGAWRRHHERAAAGTVQDEVLARGPRVQAGRLVQRDRLKAGKPPGRE